MSKLSTIFWIGLAAINLNTAIYNAKTLIDHDIEGPKIVEKYEGNEVSADETIKALQESSDKAVTSALILPISIAALGSCAYLAVKEAKKDDYSF